jgi:hypothetical protein
VGPRKGGKQRVRLISSAVNERRRKATGNGTQASRNIETNKLGGFATQTPECEEHTRT